jgi:hypothetical protein
MAAKEPCIEFSGRVQDGLGIAMWQADGSGPEPAAVGHTFSTPLYPITAHYYIASRDYVDPKAPGGLLATALGGDWPRLRAALAAHAKRLSDLVIRLPLTTPGGDREGIDWSYQDHIETRHLYPKAPLLLLLGHVPLIEFAPRRLILTEDYNGAETFADVKISLSSDPAPERRAAATAHQVASALLADLRDRSVKFIVDAIRLVPQTFAGDGRTHGRFADIPAARLQVV